MAIDRGSPGIPGLAVLAEEASIDARGFFHRLFGSQQHAGFWNGRPVGQVNFSHTERVGAVRGLHFQFPPEAEAKLVRCVRGEVLDVVVDLRPDSPTFLEWAGVRLSEERRNGIFVPEGCAHGFQLLKPCSELIYVHSGKYAPEREGGVRWDDPLLSIDWPLTATELSDRDWELPLLESRSNAENRFSSLRGL